MSIYTTFVSGLKEAFVAKIGNSRAMIAAHGILNVCVVIV